MNPPRIFLSHTDQTRVDREATTAILVELRRLGLDVWIDREHSPAPSSREQQEAGPTPDNPVFQNIVSAMSESDAVLFVVSSESFRREFVRLEFDPRVLFKKFRAKHPDTKPDALPFYLALAAPIEHPSELWVDLLDNTFPSRVLDISSCDRTPFMLPAVLSTMVREVAPEYLLPLDPSYELTVRDMHEIKSMEAPGCPPGASAPTWRRLEGFLGLGPLFPGPLSLVDEDQLTYGLHRIQCTANVPPTLPTATNRSDLEIRQILWSANMMLRSHKLRVQNGHDIPVEYGIPIILHQLQPSLNELTAAVYLQFGYALLTSELCPDLEKAGKFLQACGDYFLANHATPLAALSLVLQDRAMGRKPTNSIIAPDTDVFSVFQELGVDPQDTDLQRLHHGILDSAFPGPRIESTEKYRTDLQSFVRSFWNIASKAKMGYAKSGEERFNPEYWRQAIPETEGIWDLLKNDADLNVKDDQGRTPLIIAANYGDIALIHSLLEKEVDVNAQDDDGASALIIAAHKGNAEIVYRLLDNYADVNLKNQLELTALHFAAQEGKVKIVKTLLENGADVNAKNKDGATPLMLAAQHGWLDTVNVLLDNGADVNAKSKAGWTAYMVASPDYPEVRRALANRIGESPESY